MEPRGWDPGAGIPRLGAWPVEQTIGSPGEVLQSGPTPRSKAPALCDASLCSDPTVRTLRARYHVRGGHGSAQHPWRPLSSLPNPGPDCGPEPDDPIPLPARCTTPGTMGASVGTNGRDPLPWNSAFPPAPSSGFEWMSGSQGDSSRVPKNTRCSPRVHRGPRPG